MMKLTFWAAVFAVLTLTACEGKKSLDGYPMDKPPPSAFAPRDSEPALDGAEAKGADGAAESADGK